MEPLPADAPGILILPESSKKTALKAVLFDLYGTLFISEAGDISLAQGISRKDIFAQTFSLCGMEKEAGAIDPEEFRNLFFEKISEDHRKSRNRGNLTPEVDIREIWKEALSTAGISADSTMIEKIAVTYESLANRTWPMPGLHDMISAVVSGGYETGIISNAQFYSELLFEAHLGLSASALGFNPQLCYYSYREKVAKPGRKMFENAADFLEREKGIGRDEAIYIGNDMRNDIWPASLSGFKTCLFAGDRRSLRLRENESDLSGLKPDFTITGLSALGSILNIKQTGVLK